MRKTINTKVLDTKYFSQDKFVNLHLNSIRKYNKPTPAEELELYNRWLNGDVKAREELMLRNQLFIFSLAKIYSRDSSELSDYVSEGTIGLAKALDDKKYNPSKGFTFLTYAVWYIRREMNAYLNKDRDMVQKSNNAKYGKKIEEIKSDFWNKNARMPSDDEIIEIMKDCYELDVVNKCDVYDLNVSSINDTVTEDYTVEEDSEFAVRTASFNEYETESESEYNKEMLSHLFECLNITEKKIIKMSFGLGEYDCEMDIESIADSIGYKPSQVKKVIEKSLKKMQQYAKQQKVAI